MINPVERADPDEPQETRELSKSKMYQILAEQYLLPDKDSKGVSRSYLVKVWRNMVYRVPRKAILEFESRLALDETRKQPFYTLSLLSERFDRFLLSLGMRPLGFGEFTCPEENWYSRVLRYVDDFNCLEAFQKRVAGASRPPVFAGRG